MVCVYNSIQSTISQPLESTLYQECKRFWSQNTTKNSFITQHLDYFRKLHLRATFYNIFKLIFIQICLHVCWLHLSLCNPMGCSQLGSSVYGILHGLPCPPQGIFPTQGSDPHLLCLLPWQVGSLPLVPGKPLFEYNCCTVWRRQWQPTPVFLPRESQGWGSLVGCSPWGRTELDTTEVTQQPQQKNQEGRERKPTPTIPPYTEK